MKQIYVGSVQKNKLYTKIQQTLRLPIGVLVGVFVLLVLIPILLKNKIFNNIGGTMSPVVYVETYSGTGSAVYVGNNNLLTAAHVVADMAIGDMCEIQFQDPNSVSGGVINAVAELVAMGKYLPTRASEEDYALLRIHFLDASRIAQACGFGNESMVKVGDPITVEGYAAGAWSTTKGTLSNIKGGILENNDLYVVDAKAWHGNSGGALFDKNNNLIGIVISGGAIDGINDDQTYALKVSKIKTILSAKGFQLN